MVAGNGRPGKRAGGLTGGARREYVRRVQPFTGKIVLEEAATPPRCPACEAPLDRLHWHKIRGGPSLMHYVVVLSCPGCRGVLDILEGGGGNGAVMA